MNKDYVHDRFESELKIFELRQISIISQLKFKSECGQRDKTRMSLSDVYRIKLLMSQPSPN